MAAATVATLRTPPNAQPAIEFFDLGMDYADDTGRPLQALSAINFKATRGEFISIVGTSGCGKTTLLKIAAGLVSPTNGEIRIFGQPVRGPTQDIGFVFQTAVLLRWRTILQNILLQAEVRKVDMMEYEARARSLLAIVGLAGFENKYPYQLSGGMQQRASICRALLHDPPLLLMDEPFGALDAMTREAMHLELQEIWMDSGKTVLFVTHSIAEAVFLSNRVIVLSSRPGRIREDVNIDLARPRELGLEEEPQFGRLVNYIRGLLDQVRINSRRREGTKK